MLIESQNSEFVKQLKGCGSYGCVSDVLHKCQGEYAGVTDKDIDVTIDISKSIKKNTDKLLKAFGSKSKRGGY